LILYLQRYFSSVSPMWTDGALYVLIGIFQAASACFGSDEAAKYIPDIALFWLRTGCNISSAGLLALKMFRSTSFSEHIENKKQQQVNNNIA